MKRSHILAVLTLGLAIVPGTPAGAVDAKLIKRAIDRGISALRELQTPNGTWHHPASGEAGMTSLAGLTLVECGAGMDDQAVQKAAAAVRQAAPNLRDTYSLALAILFLDRLDDAADVPLIQVLAIRLMYGQRSSGAWGYDCPLLGGEAESTLVARGARPGGADRKEAVKPRDGKGPPRELSPEVKDLLAAYAAHTGDPARVARVTQDGRPFRGFDRGGEDHSNTQFATLGLWVARRHGIPVDQSLKAVDGHFRQCQNSDGGWGYFANQPSTPTMTAAGILGLAVGDGAALDQRKRRGEAVKPATNKDAQLARALAAIGSTIGQPLAQLAGPPFGPRGRMMPRPHAGGGRSFYFLWSLERVGMGLGLETIGKKDWYAWGARALLASQAQDGHWHGDFWQGGADTCFALLFLARSNLVKDLTANLRGMVPDPGQVTLRSEGVGGERLMAPRTDKPDIGPGGGADNSLPAPSPPEPAVKPEPPARPPVVPRTDPVSKPEPPARPPVAPRADSPIKPEQPTRPPLPEPDASHLAEEIVRAPADRFAAIVYHVRDARGVVNTEALAAAIPHLPRENKKKAREALAERLSRMRPASLANYLKDDDAEIRRGAALALAMKESKEHIADLINLLGDREETVVLGARSALKELTRQDFGPAAGASAEDRMRALAQWRAWWTENKSK